MIVSTPFARLIVVEFGRPGNYRHITNVGDAPVCLATSWRLSRGMRHRHAVQHACGYLKVIIPVRTHAGHSSRQRQNSRCWRLITLHHLKRVKIIAKLIYDVAQHDGSWFFKDDNRFSETFPNHEDALRAAETAASEQHVAGSTDGI